MKNYESIDQYFKSFPASTQKILKEVRAAIKEAAPDATEKISYQMPTFFQNRNLVHYAAYKKHIGFYPGSRAIRVFESDLKKYKHAKGSIQFPIDQPMPIPLIKKIAKYTVKENSRKKK